MSEVVTTKTTGVFTGILDVMVAKITTPDSATAAPIYDTPRVLGEGIEVSIAPAVCRGRIERQ